MLHLINKQSWGSQYNLKPFHNTKISFFHENHTSGAWVCLTEMSFYEVYFASQRKVFLKKIQILHTKILKLLGIAHHVVWTAKLFTCCCEDKTAKLS